MDCFVASAPRNDGVRMRLHISRDANPPEACIDVVPRKIEGAASVGWVKRSVPTIEDDAAKHGGHGANAFAHALTPQRAPVTRRRRSGGPSVRWRADRPRRHSRPR